jgi:hypothetical protein
MSTLKATNLSHASAASPNIVLDSAGKVTFGGAVAGAGMDLITPTSVAGTGVTVSGGAVTFTAATSVSVNGCFTATYSNYRIVMSAVSAAGAIDVNMRLRAAGTDASGAATYSRQYLTAFNTTATAGTAATTFWHPFYANTVAGFAAVELENPATAVTTRFTAFGGAEVGVLITSGYHTAATAYDGFTLYPGSSSITGTLHIYGYRNS